MTLTKCPVCDAVVEPYTDYMDHTLMEEHIICQTCDRYHFEFITGSYVQGLQIEGEWVNWYWSYGEIGVDMSARHAEFNEALKRARACYQQEVQHG